MNGGKYEIYEIGEDGYPDFQDYPRMYGTGRRQVEDDEMYGKAAEIFANDLYDELIQSDVINSKGILGGYNSAQADESCLPDKNFILWSLIPFIAAFSIEGAESKSIDFSQICTIRRDGGKNICYASVMRPDIKPPKHNESMKNFKGPFWNGLTDDITLWTIDSEWSEKRISENYQIGVVRDLSLLSNYLKDITLSKEDYSYLAEKGYISVYGEADELFKTALRIIYIKDEDTKKKLLSIGNRIKDKHRTEFEQLKAPYIKAVLESTPKHLRKMRMYGLQYIFCSDAWFILHCLKVLVGNGKLALPSESQKSALTTVLFNQQ